jgi:Ecdysteroid kinase-like family
VTATPVERPEDVTPEWLEGVLGCGPVASIASEQIGTGQMSENHRLAITYAGADAAGPASVVLKIAARDQTSRQTGLALGLYEREVRFYLEVAPLIGGPLAPCHHGAFDPETGAFSLILGDAGPAVQGDEVAGCTPEAARVALAELGRLHAPVLCHSRLEETDWLNRDSPLDQTVVEQLLAGFVERYRARLDDAHLAVAHRFVASFDGWSDAQGDDAAFAHGIVHGDYRLDNLLFGREGADRPLTVVDWQTVSWGPAATDVAYFLGCALTVEDRRAHADELLDVYLEALGPDAPMTRDQLLEGVRRQSFFGVMMAVISPMLVQQTERGDDMFMATFARHCQQVLDLDALETLPPPSAPQPLSPEPADEAPHPPGGEPLWNESWYFDVADPEQGASWSTTLICGPDRPTVALVDFAAPLPGDDLVVRSDAFESAQVCEAPLERYRVTVRGRGERFDDPAALLRGEPGEPVDAELDLVWETAGRPFRYRLATRYEIACRVRGTLRVGEETFELRGAPGQRDHSWGVRDWWSMNWIWSAGHLDDGTHLHGLDLRIPNTPRMGTGYVQTPDGELMELSGSPAEEQMQPDGLGGPTTQRFGDSDVTFEPLGHGPLRLVADDGRVALFPRAWARLRASDGRTGVGWIEWNV